MTVENNINSLGPIGAAELQLYLDINTEVKTMFAGG